MTHLRTALPKARFVPILPTRGRLHRAMPVIFEFNSIFLPRLQKKFGFPKNRRARQRHFCQAGGKNGKKNSQLNLLTN